MQIYRTPDACFAGLDYPFAPHWRETDGIRLHHIDEGPIDRPVALLIHGEPTWSYLYRNMIRVLVPLGYRCIAPDHAGFGKSDKPVDDGWYDIAGHCRRLRHLIDTLDLRRITLFVQDWGGPIGLRMLVDQPDRFERVVVMSTWLHRPDFDYSPGIRAWATRSTDPAKLGGDMDIGRIVAGSLLNPDADRAAAYAAYAAPFAGAESKAGPRRFPQMLPLFGATDGDPQGQEECYRSLPRLGLPMHLFWGDGDVIFPPDQGRAWAATIPGASFDLIANAGHFIQEDAGPAIVERLAGYL